MDQKRLSKALDGMDQSKLNKAVAQAGKMLGASSGDVKRMQDPKELQKLLSKITSNDLKTIEKILGNPKAAEQILSGGDVRKRVSEILEE